MLIQQRRRFSLRFLIEFGYAFHWTGETPNARPGYQSAVGEKWIGDWTSDDWVGGVGAFSGFANRRNRPPKRPPPSPALLQLRARGLEPTNSARGGFPSLEISHFAARLDSVTMPPSVAHDPPPEAVDCVAYLNEAWTPYHAVLASCRRLAAAGYEVRDRIDRSPLLLLSFLHPAVSQGQLHPRRRRRFRPPWPASWRRRPAVLRAGRRTPLWHTTGASIRVGSGRITVLGGGPAS